MTLEFVELDNPQRHHLGFVAHDAQDTVAHHVCAGVDTYDYSVVDGCHGLQVDYFEQGAESQNLVAEPLAHLIEQSLAALFVPALESVGIGRFELEREAGALLLIVGKDAGQLRVLQEPVFQNGRYVRLFEPADKLVFAGIVGVVGGVEDNHLE